MIKQIASKVNPIGMSYWRNINYHSGMNCLLLFLSVDDNLVIFELDKNTLTINQSWNLNVNHTGEGCFFSAINPYRLFIPIENELITLDVKTAERKVIISSTFKLWQVHSSIDERTFSATLRTSDYQNHAWGIFRPGDEERIYSFEGEPDECQIDKGGKFLLIKEDNYNRIIKLEGQEIWKVSNEDGALGHSDCGFGFAVGENDVSSLPGACDKIDFETRIKSNLYSTGIWNMGYVSNQNNRNLITTPNELILVETGQRWNNLTESQEYSHRPKANLCPLAEFFAFTSFVNGSLNAYVVKI